MKPKVAFLLEACAIPLAAVWVSVIPGIVAEIISKSGGTNVYVTDDTSALVALWIPSMTMIVPCIAGVILVYHLVKRASLARALGLAVSSLILGAYVLWREWYGVSAGERLEVATLGLMCPIGIAILAGIEMKRERFLRTRENDPKRGLSESKTRNP